MTDEMLFRRQIGRVAALERNHQQLEKELAAAIKRLDGAVDAIQRLAATTRALAETVENMTTLLFPEEAALIDAIDAELGGEG
jgi:hypothetical protein